MDDHTRLTIKIGHARQVERILLLLGWATVALGIIAAAACVLFWATGDLTTERAIGILLGVSFVAILSGATAIRCISAPHPGHLMSIIHSLPTVTQQWLVALSLSE